MSENGDITNYDNSFSVRLKTIRSLRHLKQTDVAKALNIPQ